MVNQTEVEKQLIGIWCSGQFLQYTELFESRDFHHFPGTFENIKGAIAEAKPVSIVTAAGEYKTNQLAKLMTESFPSQVETLVAQMQEIVAERKYNEFISIPIEGTPYEKASMMIEQMRAVMPQKTKSDINKQLIDLMDEIDKRKTAERNIGYGIPKLDSKTNGMHKQNLIIISGRPGVGKSAFALQVANNALKHKYKVLFVSLEMGESELLERLVMHLSDIDGNAMKTGNLSRGEWDQTSQAIDIISGYPIEINTSVRTPGQLRIEIARHQPDLVIVDQLGLLREEERHASRREEIVSITRKLKLMAMDFNIPIIALAQINRDASENYPTLANLKESGSIEEDANVVIMLHSLSQSQCSSNGLNYCENESGRKTMTVMLAKHRNGETGNIPVVYTGRKYKFVEIGK